MRRRDDEVGIDWPERLRVFRLEDWPPVRGEVDEGCLRPCCSGDDWMHGTPPRADLEHDEFAYLDYDPVLAAIWRDDDAYGRFKAARLAFLGKGHPKYGEQMLNLIIEQRRRNRARFAEYRARDTGRVDD